MDKYEYWFASIVQMGHGRKKWLIENLHDAKEIYQIDKWRKNKLLGITDHELDMLVDSKANWKLEEEWNTCQSKEVHMVTYRDSNYPKKLLPYKDMPYALFYKGKLPDENVKSAAIVGARQCSPYGEKYAMEYSKALVQCGVQVISGMALGIDGIAQRVALEYEGESYGILGCGVDICYPRGNVGLYRDLAIHGGVISEQPLGIPPLSMNFPLRNRIISALADVVLVIEAKERSGSLITADMALEQGKEVYALPGMVSSALSRGCNNLIKQGAGLLSSPQELMEDLGIFSPKNSRKNDENKIMLETQEKLVYSCLCLEAKHIEGILQQTKIPVQELVNLLVSLELKGYIRQISNNYYVKI